MKGKRHPGSCPFCGDIGKLIENGGYTRCVICGHQILTEEQKAVRREAEEKDRRLREQYPDREFDIGREVPRIIYILETRRRAGGPWQPYEFPFEPSDTLDKDPMYGNTRDNVQRQLDGWENCVRSAEWEWRVTEYTPREGL